VTGSLEIPVRAGGGTRDYPVVIGSGLRHEVGGELLRRAPSVRRWALVTDENVAPLYGDAVQAGAKEVGRGGPRITLPAGEIHKTRERWSDVTDRLLQAGLGRDGGIIALGGGVVGDLAGFVAATYMRGIPVVQVPTSLLAMLDASVGGKTGVDTPAGKNLVGAFHPPAAVIIDPEVVASLPMEERRQGLAEAIKHGAIVDSAYGEAIAAAAAALLAAEPEALFDLVRRSVEIKADVVSRDEREGGLREILNFGHTVAHALEHMSDYRIPHGSAVAMGMVWEAEVGEEEGVSDPGTAERIGAWLRSVGLPTHLEAVDGSWPEGGRGPLVARFTEGLLRDKKARGGAPRVVLLARCGTVARTGAGEWARPVPLRVILRRHPLAGA
jgi:3-dehydroquinate synthase